jgi:hypothetical protein
MAITGISPPSAATYFLLSRTNAPEQAAATTATTATTTDAKKETTPAARTDVSGTLGALSPAVLAALMGQELKLRGSPAGV